jgi:hypothetical protein
MNYFFNYKCNFIHRFHYRNFPMRLYYFLKDRILLLNKYARFNNFNIFLQLQYAFLARSQAPKIPDIHSIWDLGVWAFAMVFTVVCDTPSSSAVGRAERLVGQGQLVPLPCFRHQKTLFAVSTP